MGKRKCVRCVQQNYWPVGLGIAGTLFAVVMAVLSGITHGEVWDIPIVLLFFAVIAFCFGWQYVRISENLEREGQHVSFAKRLGLTILTMTIACAVGAAVGKAVSKRK